MRCLPTLLAVGLVLGSAAPVLAQPTKKPRKQEISWDGWPPELKERYEQKQTQESVYNQQWVSSHIIREVKVAEENWAKAAAGDADAFEKARKALNEANKRMADTRGDSPAWGPKLEEDLKLHEWLDARTVALYKACEASHLLRIATEKPPAEVYELPDREKLRQALEQKWRAAWPTDKVLAVRVEDDAWHRKVENRKLRNGNTEVIDTSTLSWRVYVAYTDKIAVGYVVDAYRNNLDDTITWGVYAKPSTGFYNYNDYALANVPAAGGGSSWLYALGCCCPLALVAAGGAGAAVYLKKKKPAPPTEPAPPPPPPPPAPPV